jgi:hypothetical protein
MNYQQWQRDRKSLGLENLGYLNEKLVKQAIECEIPLIFGYRSTGAQRPQCGKLLYCDSSIMKPDQVVLDDLTQLYLEADKPKEEAKARLNQQRTSLCRWYKGAQLWGCDSHMNFRVILRKLDTVDPERVTYIAPPPRYMWAELEGEPISSTDLNSLIKKLRAANLTYPEWRPPIKVEVPVDKPDDITIDAKIAIIDALLVELPRDNGYSKIRLDALILKTELVLGTKLGH